MSDHLKIRMTTLYTNAMTRLLRRFSYDVDMAELGLIFHWYLEDILEILNDNLYIVLSSGTENGSKLIQDIELLTILNTSPIKIAMCSAVSQFEASVSANTGLYVLQCISIDSMRIKGLLRMRGLWNYSY